MIEETKKEYTIDQVATLMLAAHEAHLAKNKQFVRTFVLSLGIAVLVLCVILAVW